MSGPPPEVLRAVAQAEALAAFVALQSHPPEELRPALVRAVRAAGLPEILPDPVRPVVLGTARALLRQAADLATHPDRPPGWSQPDPALLQDQGLASAMIPAALAAGAAANPALAAILGQPARFLDVGTGVGRLAISAARRWPAMRVVGLDRWDVPLALARAAVAEEGLGDRIALVEADIATWSSPEPFDLVWLPGPFLPAEVLARALGTSRRLLRPGGVVVLGSYGGSDPLGRALADVRTLRSGGVVLDDPAALATLGDAGFTGCAALPHGTPAPIRFHVGTAP